MYATQFEIPKSVGSFTFCVLSSVCCPLFSTFSNLKQLVGGMGRVYVGDTVPITGLQIPRDAYHAYKGVSGY